MSKRDFVDHVVPVEVMAFKLATFGLAKEGIDADKLRRAMREEISSIANQPPMGMLMGVFMELYMAWRGMKYGMRGMVVGSRIMGETITYDADQPELKAFKADLKMHLFGAQLGVRESISWLRDLQNKAQL